MVKPGAAEAGVGEALFELFIREGGPFGFFHRGEFGAAPYPAL